MSCYFDDEDIFEYGGKIIRHIHKGEHSVNVIRKNNGEVIASNGHFIGYFDDEEIEDKIDEFEEGWREITWTDDDWADYYGCSIDQVQDCMDDDIKDLY